MFFVYFGQNAKRILGCLGKTAKSGKTAKTAKTSVEPAVLRGVKTRFCQFLTLLRQRCQRVSPGTAESRGFA